MGTVIEYAEPPRRDERPAPAKDLAGRYRLVWGVYNHPLSGKALEDAIAGGRAPYEHVHVGSILELDHDEADLLLEQGVIEPVDPPRKGQVAVAKAKAQRAL